MMERLTLSGLRLSKKSATITEIVEKLCDYEDTGITPEEIERLKNGGWIPVSERLPEEHQECQDIFDTDTLAVIDTVWRKESDLVLVTVYDYEKDKKIVCDDCTVNGKWANFSSDNFKVIAWQPLPEPYKECD